MDVCGSVCRWVGVSVWVGGRCVSHMLHVGLCVFREGAEWVHVCIQEYSM